MDKVTLDGLVEQLKAMPSDKDRQRLLRNGLDNFTVSASIASQLVSLFHMSDAIVAAAVLVYPLVEDKDNFEAEVLAKFKFEEERAEVREKVGMY